MTRAQSSLLLAAFLAATNLCYGVAVLRSGGDRIFRGFLLNVTDNANVLAQMAQATRQGILYSNPYASEGAPRVYFHPVWALMGGVERATGASLLVLFHLLRLGAASAVAIVVLRLARRCCPRGAALAATLALFGGGLGPILRLLPVSRGLPLVMYADFMPEATPFLTVLVFAHIALALAILLAAHLQAMRALLDGSGRAAVGACALLCLLSMVHPFDVVGFVAVLLAVMLSIAIARRLSRRALFQALAIASGGLPGIIYYRWLVRAHPDLANVAHLSQPALSLPVMAGALGATFIAALPAILAKGEGVTGTRLYLAAWLLTQLALCFATPLVPFGRRLIMGCLVPAALLAGPWLHARFHGGSAEKGVVVAFATVAFLGTAASVGHLAAHVHRRGSPEFQWSDEAELRIEIGRRLGSGDRLVAWDSVGEDVPWLSPARAVVGYYALTPGYEERKAAVARFFDPATPDSFRARFLARAGATWVAQTSPMAETDLRRSPLLETVLDLPRARLLRVRADRLASVAGGRAP